MNAAHYLNLKIFHLINYFQFLKLNYLILIASFDRIPKLIFQFLRLILYFHYCSPSMILPLKLFIALHFHNLTSLDFDTDLILPINLQPSQILLSPQLLLFSFQDSKYFVHMIQFMITMLLLNIANYYYFIFLLIHVYSQLEWHFMDFAIIQSIKQ